MPAQDDRLAAIAAAAAAVLRQTPYHVVRAGDVAAAVRLPGQAGRSAVWLYNEVHNRRVLVALAAAHAWQEFAGQASWSPPDPIGSVTAARSAAVAALGVIVAFHRAEHPLMTQVGYGIGDISTAEKRKLAAGTGVTAPSWPDSPWGRAAAAAWNGRCDVFTDFLRPVLRACAESVTYLAEPNITESASRLSDITFRTCLADREGPVDLLARGLAALWFERDLARLAGALPRDLESAETALAAVARRRTDPRAEANANAVVVRVLLEAGTLHRRCVGEAQRTVALWQSLAADLDGPAASDATAHDLQRLSDAASHLGLAAARFGDRRTAADAWQLSRRVADQGLGRDQSRIARADTNLAALAAETGHGEQAGIVVAERAPDPAGPAGPRAAGRGGVAAPDRDRAHPDGRGAADRRGDRERPARHGAAGGPAGPAERPGARRYRRGADHLGPDPARGRPPGRRPAPPGGGRRHPAKPVPAHLLPGSGRSHLAGQGGPRAGQPPDRARPARRPGGADRLVPRPGLVPARLHRPAAGRDGPRRARPARGGDRRAARRPGGTSRPAARRGARPAGRGRRPVPRRARAAARRGRGRGGRAGPAGRRPRPRLAAGTGPDRRGPRTAGPSSCWPGRRLGWATPSAPRSASARSPASRPRGSIPVTR